MVVRRLWYDLVREAEAAACSDTSRLVGDSSDPPVNVMELSRSIGARLERFRFTTSRQGSLCRIDGKWIIRLRAEPSSLSPRERFVAAHELSHLMLLQRGVSRPVSEQEYWLLEAACNRVASALLVPIQQGPSGMLEPDSTRSWFGDLIDRWRLPGKDAARVICQRTTNCISAAFLKDDSLGMSVTWSYSRRPSSNWPIAGEYLDEDLSEIISELVSSDKGTTSVRRTVEATLVGFRWLEPDSESPRQTRLDLHERGNGGDYADTAPVAFMLENSGQLALPL